MIILKEFIYPIVKLLLLKMKKENTLMVKVSEMMY